MGEREGMMARIIYELCWTTEDSGPQNLIYDTQKRAEKDAESYHSATHDGVLVFHWKDGNLFADDRWTGYSVVERNVF
jgi:hypothetical protein